MAKSKNVTIRELKEASAKLGHPDPVVSVYRTPTQHVCWYVQVMDNSEWPMHVLVNFHSRQGAMRMALAALRAK